MPNCNGPDDSLAADLSIRINDSPDPNWWLSPDIKLFRLGVGGAEVSDGKAVLDGANYVDVRVYRTAQPLLDSTFEILVELWVCNPSLTISPLSTTSTRRLFTGTIRAASLPASSSAWLSSFLPPDPLPDPPPPPQGQVNPAPYPAASGIPVGNVNISTVGRRIRWIPDSADSVQQAGHKCLIARVYQDGLPDPKPDSECFHVRPDDHVAQLNLEIVQVASKMRAFNFQIRTAGLNPDMVERATIRAIADRVPSTAVLNAILPGLRQFQGFRQIAQIAPERFALQVPDRFSPAIRDNSRLQQVKPINPREVPFQDLWRYTNRDGFNFGRFREVMFDPKVVLQDAITVRKFNAPINTKSMQTISTRSQQIAPLPPITPRLTQMVEQAAPTFEADIQLPPQEVATFEFTANLPENSQPGDAHIFHVMHIAENQQVIGGLTIVAVVS